MHVYIILKETVRRISGITLVKYSVPQCSGVLEERLDPSLWFKALVLDSVLVECDRKNVFYNKWKPSEREDIHGYRENMLSKDVVHDFFQDKERVFSEEEFPEYDPTFDDLFTTALEILRDLSTETSHVATYEHLFKLLHIFILPKIKLEISDQERVNKVLNDIEKYHAETENEIQMAMKSERNTERSLNEQTKQLLRKEADFCRPSYVAACHHEFIGVFLERLDKYIAKCRDDLQVYTSKITPIRDSDMEEDIRRLKLLRSERHLVKEGIDRALVVREEIRKNINRQSSVHEHINQLSFGFQNSYVKTYRCLQMRQDEVPKMIRTKIKISAVREAVVLTLKEINNDGHSYGYNRVKGSFDAESNIIDLNQVPDEWASLPAKVKHLLENSKAGSRHFEFCERIKVDCQKLLNACGAGGLKPGNFLLDATTNCYTSRWSSGSISKTSCEAICNMITSHISEFAENLSFSEDLVKDFQENPQRTKNKVYMCYGEKVTAELLPVLSRVYEESYRALTRDLCNFLATVDVCEVFSSEIKMLDKIMEKGMPSKAVPAISVTEVEPICDTVSYEDQRATFSVQQTESGSGGMTTSPRVGKKSMKACTTIAEELEGTEVIYMKPDNRTIRRPQSVVLRENVTSERKRHGISFTTEETDELMSVFAEGDGWADEGGYVDMNIINRTRRNSTSKLNRFHTEFADFQLLVKEEIDASTMNAKLRSMTGILRYVETKLTHLKIKAGDSDPACTDELISVIILLLLRLDSEDLLRLYAHINLLDNLCPNFMMGNIHNYALVTLQGPYHVLFEQAKLRQSQ